MSLIASGVIYFTSELNCSALNDISFYIVQEAIKNKLGILLGANIPQWLKNRYVEVYHIDTSIDGTKMIFHLSESVYYANCEKLFELVMIDYSEDGEVRNVNVSETDIIKLQYFFKCVSDNAYVSHIWFCFDNDDGNEATMKCYDCFPEQFGDVFKEEIIKIKSWNPTFCVNIKSN